MTEQLGHFPLLEDNLSDYIHIKGRIYFIDVKIFLIKKSTLGKEEKKNNQIQWLLQQLNG
jgi:hypothetical protein